MNNMQNLKTVFGVGFLIAFTFIVICGTTAGAASLVQSAKEQGNQVLLPLVTLPAADNSPPIANTVTYTLREDTTLSVTAADGVLVNDSDADNEPLSAVLAEDVAHGRLELRGDGSFDYTPSADFHGADSFTYRALDAVASSSPAVVELLVQPVNDVPSVQDDEYVLDTDGGLNIDEVDGVLANDTDPDGDLLNATLLVGASHGALALSARGGFTYDPEPGFAGKDSFVYAASDGSAVSAPATVVIHVSPDVSTPNRPPRIVSGMSIFEKQVIDDTVDEIHFAVAGDLDADGDIDIVATDYVDGLVFWYENDGNERFTVQVLDPAMEGAYPAATGDVDGDGDTDVMVGGYLADTFAWYRNDGGDELARFDIDTEADGAHSIITADVDSDNDMDLVTASQDAGVVVWYENDGTQAYTKHTVDDSAAGAKRADVADVDNDGDLDLLAASFDINEIAWYENDGSQTFTKRVIYTEANGAYYVTSGDCDNDGDVDLFSASQRNNDVNWFENDGTGTFVTQVVDANVPGARTVVITDLNGDGHLDALATSVIFGAVYWYANDGTCNFTKHDLDLDAAGAYGVFAVDIDGDNDMDVLSAARDANEVALYTQTRAHSVTVELSGTVTIDGTILQTTDPDDGPGDLVYTLLDAPERGELQLDNTRLAQGDTFTQADVDEERVRYVHTTTNVLGDRFAFAVADGGEDGTQPAGGFFTVSVVASGEGVVHLPLDEGSGTIAADVSGQGNDGALVNGAAFEAETGNGSPFSVRFDGVDDRIDLGVIDVEGSGLTLAAWFNGTSFPGPSSDPRLISKASGIGADEHIFMLGTIISGGEVRLRARIRVGGATTTLIAPGGRIEPGTWYHAAATYDGALMRLYLDGAEVGSTPLSGAVDTDPAMAVAVGAQPPGAGANHFDGLIDDVRILARPMSDTEIQQLAARTP